MFTLGISAINAFDFGLMIWPKMKDCIDHLITKPKTIEPSASKEDLIKASIMIKKDKCQITKVCDNPPPIRLKPNSNQIAKHIVNHG